MSDCGHTEREHENMMIEINHQIASGNLSMLVPQASNESLPLTVQTIAAELVIRSDELETAKIIWDALDEEIRNTLFVDKEEDSEIPEIYQMVMQQRKIYQDKAAAQEFTRDAGKDLDELFNQHGVYKAHTDDTEWPGQYL